MFKDLESLKGKLRELWLPILEDRRPGDLIHGGLYPRGTLSLSIPAGPEERR